MEVRKAAKNLEKIEEKEEFVSVNFKETAGEKIWDAYLTLVYKGTLLTRTASKLKRLF